MPGLKDRIIYSKKNSIFFHKKTYIEIKSKKKPDIINIEDEIYRKKANNRATVLEIVGDLPEENVKPPKDVLFICKLNPMTNENALELIFSQFGTVISCDVIRDLKTQESLNYGFIGFDCETSCEKAYFKMNNAIIDERRVKVDFSQSVAYLWKRFKRK
eukprot:gnl/TRDRNA2_/TRDRNA2_177495_c2_seq1.p1 gnl/TRDRNA2_/TRDRNA2_177495_c2~~gnl/TRDRNA2_/TRDRNA2_177495_c2_seq1.p1  ORF type:complete len:159 (+),score=4.57 gnl/TRDRNA2_/TRDRNA2_177495_c2_seq1:940-1416(+)